MKPNNFARASALQITFSRGILSSFIAASTLVFLLFSSAIAFGGSATWKLSPTSGTWNNAANWDPMTIPNGPTDVATFAASSKTLVSLSGDTEVNEIVIMPGADSFVISSTPTKVLTISGVGVINNSGITQEIAVDEDESGGIDGLQFKNSASAGHRIVYTAMPGTISTFGTGGWIWFEDNSSADHAVFNICGVDGDAWWMAELHFRGTSTAADATISTLIFPGVAYPTQPMANTEAGRVWFEGESTAGNAKIYNDPTGEVHFNSTANAGHSQIMNYGLLEFREGTSLSDATIINNYSGTGWWGRTSFLNATAGNGKIVNNGGDSTGKRGAETYLVGNAGAATLIAKGGVNGGGGGLIAFEGGSIGGTSRIEIFGNGSLDVSYLSLSGITIGSLEGDGLVFLGSHNLTSGSSNLDTRFSGIIQDGGIGGGLGGSFSKIGTGTLTLNGENTYTGSTTVSEGALIISNTEGSGTGTGPVNINAGTLGGSGTIAGAVAVGTGSGSGAFLAPAFGCNKQVTLTLLSSLTLQADATYTYTFKARPNRTRTDLVIANGVTINGAAIALQGLTEGTLRPGMELTLIRNTSANPISGTFSNLADGAIVTINGNNLQASYSGGDGNDLTLTVVP